LTSAMRDVDRQAPLTRAPADPVRRSR
jgi:hypothetical protein